LADKQVDRPIPTLESDYRDYLLNYRTIQNGLLPSNYVDLLRLSKIPDANIADDLAARFSGYDNFWQPVLAGTKRTKYWPSEFVGSKPNPTTICVKEWQEYIDPETGQITQGIPADAPEGETQIGTTQTTFIIDYDTGVLLTNDLLAMGYNWLAARSENPSIGTIAAYSLLNQGWLFTSGQEGTGDTLLTLLAVEPSFLERLSAVIAAGNRIYLKNLALSQKYDVLHGVRHVCSAIPIDAVTNKFLAVNSPYWYHVMGHLPTAEQICWLLMSNGIEPIGLVNPKNPDIIPATTPDWTTGRAKTSQVGLSQSFHDHWNWCMAAAMGCYRALSGERIPELSDNIGPGVLVSATGSQDLDPDPSHKRGSLFGALLSSATYKDANGNLLFAYPQLDNDSDWNDLNAAVMKGKCTNLQCWYLVNDGLLIDAVFRAILRDGQTAGTLVSQFQAQPNGPFLYQLAQMKTPPTN
jgi:hypothetical protein